eukprot:TRINITY_DN1565_c0_g1_i2.p1 TRINITY_DN1565_c0_g1~~TRINITY_DN1565_c0_g1_i2.p1  ORF type:complete len:221 (-),score=34.20 TRINITY_DN1565_c0_g1_i2:149-811(-)
MWNDNLWILAPVYLSQCARHGVHFIKTLLTHQKLNSEEKVMKLVQLCDEYNLFVTKSEICTRYAVQRMYEQDFGGAITWFLKAENQLKVSSFCRSVITKYIKKTCDFQQIKSISDCVTEDQRKLNLCLDFLCSYKEVKDLQLYLGDEMDVENAEKTEAFKACRLGFQLCNNILINGKVPTQFRLAVFNEAMVFCKHFGKVQCFSWKTPITPQNTQPYQQF